MDEKDVRTPWNQYVVRPYSSSGSSHDKEHFRRGIDQDLHIYGCWDQKKQLEEEREQLQLNQTPPPSSSERKETKLAIQDPSEVVKPSVVPIVPVVDAPVSSSTEPISLLANRKRKSVGKTVRRKKR